MRTRLNNLSSKIKAIDLYSCLLTKMCLNSSFQLYQVHFNLVFEKIAAEFKCTIPN